MNLITVNFLREENIDGKKANKKYVFKPQKILYKIFQYDKQITSII